MLITLIIIVELSNDIIKELDYIVNYIERKGYLIVTLDRMIQE